MTAAVRSFLTASAIAASVSAVAVTPLAAPSAATASSAAVRLAAAVDSLTPEPTPLALDAFVVAEPTANPISDFIIYAYDLAEPWVAYGFELADYALSFIPGLWWIAPAIDLAYFSIEPLVQAGVYSFAYLLDGQFAEIGPTLALGVQEAVNNFVYFGIAWIGSLIPLPPLPPFPPVPPFGAAAVNAPAQAVSRTAAVAAAAVTQTAAPEETAVSPADIEAAEVVEAPRPAKRAAGRAASRAHSGPAVPAAAAAGVSAGSDEPAAAPQTRSKAGARTGR